MYKILMICHGNICRSPMAEYVMKKLIDDAKLSDKIYVESAATSTEEIGNPMYHRAKDELVKHGIYSQIEEGCKGLLQEVLKSDYWKNHENS